MSERRERRPDLYTPITPELLTLLDEMRDSEGYWTRVAAAGNISMTMLKRIRQFKRRTIPKHIMERLIDGTGIGDIEDFFWFTKQDLESLGIWKKPDMRGQGLFFYKKFIGMPYKVRHANRSTKRHSSTERSLEPTGKERTRPSGTSP